MLSYEDEIACAVTELAMAEAGREEWIDESSIEGLGMARYVASEHIDRLPLTRPDRQQYQKSTLVFLDPLIPLDSHLLPNPILFLDYIPAISWMTRIDDVLQAQDAADVQAGRTRVNRKTGRVQRVTAGGHQGYVRQMVGELDEGELEAVGRCRLDFERSGVPVRV